jgi:ribose/xylose/arabinose/galactoside ABC-type transport system permease subunit
MAHSEAATAGAFAWTGRSSGLRRLVGSQEGVLLLAIVALLVVVGTVNPRFVAERNLATILLGNAYIAVAAIGMSMVIISGNIDISVGSLIGVLATLSGSLAVAGAPIALSWIVPVLLSIAVTAAMGAVVAYLRIPSIVLTLGMMSVLQGGLISVTNGAWISNLPPGFQLGQMVPLGVPMPIWCMVLLTAAAGLWMRYSATGRAFYAIGGNAEAAVLSGISPRLTTVAVFAVHGLFVGIAAVLFATQLSVIQSTVPPNLALTIITASVVGGVSILGGSGTVLGSTLAAILIAAIGSSLIFVDVSPYWFRAVQGALILATVLADLARRRRRSRR